MSAVPIESAPSRVARQPRLLLSIPEAMEALAIRRDLFDAEVLPQLESVHIGRRRLVVASSLQAYVERLPRVGEQ